MTRLRSLLDSAAVRAQDLEREVERLRSLENSVKVWERGREGGAERERERGREAEREAAIAACDVSELRLIGVNKPYLS